YLRSRIPSSADLDDVVQEAYIKILRARPAGDIRFVKGYLFTIARNTAAKFFRKRKIFSNVPVADLPAWRVLDETQDVSARAHTYTQKAIVAGVIAMLPARCREIMLFGVADGLAPAEIAARLGVSESTVRTQLARGVEKCSQLLRERGVTGNA
ncbi:MAG: RNA polymerase sigma factor, partial [Opitutaceae bacterium]